MSDPYVGEIRMFGGNFAPANWSFCNGALLAISQYQALYTLIGTIYGGDGVQTFALPNLQSRVPIHQGTGYGQTYVQGQAGGVESVALTSTQIPNHTHALMASSNTAAGSSPIGSVVGAPPSVSIYRVAAPGVAMAPQAIGNAGGNVPHSNLQPYLCINFIIALFGIYPTRS